VRICTLVLRDEILKRAWNRFFYYPDLVEQEGVLTETKVSKTRSIELRCSVFATCNSIKKLKEPLVSRFMVIEMGGYSQDEFVRVAVEQLRKRRVEDGFAWFIAQEVWKTGGENANIRECVRLANLSERLRRAYTLLALES
jgi:hypothetical protein